MSHEGLVYPPFPPSLLPEQMYRYDRVERGQVTLTIENRHASVIERKTGKVREMYAYRQKHYPNAHNYRHHINGEDGCPTCDREAS